MGLLKKTPLILLAVSLLASNGVGAQQQVNNTIVNASQSGSNFTNEQLNMLNYLLSQQNYFAFSNELGKYKVSPSHYISYLQSKRMEGHVPLYWLMANYYAQNKKYTETHKWLYVATIMTQQDAYLCSDQSARDAPRKLNRHFGKPLDITRSTPQFIQEVMPYVIKFIIDLPERSDPKWVCAYSNNELPKGAEITIPRALWIDERKNILKRFM